MADNRPILAHYGITNAFPSSWPTAKDESDASEGEGEDEKNLKPTHSRKGNVRRSKSRYTVLEKNFVDRKSHVPGAQKTRDGVENLVQMDEPDALGFADSVVGELRMKGLSVQEDQAFRNRFLLSSTTFAPAMYLSQVHSNASTKDLIQGLEFLSRSIDQKSASLKVLVESNFERFVKAKSVIDNVYTEMRNQGTDPELEKARPTSRHQSRTSLHYRNISCQGPSGRLSVKPPQTERKKHALTKESEYGIYGIKAPLIDIVGKAEEIWSPALGGRERENNLKAILESIDRSEGVMEVGQEIADSIKRKDYDTLVKQYVRARDYVSSARTTAENAPLSGGQLTDTQAHKIVMTARMWLGVETQIDNFKRVVWRDLTSVQANMTMSTDRSHQEDHVALISVLLELGVEDNPIWVWLLSRYDYLKNKINAAFERSRVEIEVCRRRLATAEKPGLYSSAIHFRSPTKSTAEEKLKHLDAAPILEFWELVVHAMGNLLSLQGGILGEVLDFWDKAQSFIDGKAQRTLPTGIDGGSRRFHTLSQDDIQALQSGAIELIDALRENVFTFFVDPPIEDISMLFSPVPTESPNTPRTPRSATISPFSKPDQRLNIDLLSPPPPSPKIDEPWAAFAFWPPYANSLSGVHYLGRLLLLLATASCEMAALQPITASGAGAKKLKILVNAARERAAKAICAAWSNDAQSCKVLEDWTRGPDNRDVTRMPSDFAAFEGFVLSGLQKILYIPEVAIIKRSASEIITPPPNTLLQMARDQFMTTLYRVLEGMRENAEKPVNKGHNVWSNSRDSQTFTQAKSGGTIVDQSGGDTVDANSRSIRLLLTLSNLTLLRTTTIPSLISQFESDFSIALPDARKTLSEASTRFDTSLFQAYIQPHSEHLSKLIITSVTSPAWAPTTRPATVRPYVYTALLHLVALHTELTTTAEPLTVPVLSSLFETICKSLLDAFRARSSPSPSPGGTSSGRFSLPALMQATLDVEFFAQTLSGLYGTEKASEFQTQVYVELDRAGSDSRALQAELPEMRNVLKRLKEGTRGEFACFRKEKRGGERERGREGAESRAR